LTENLELNCYPFPHCIIKDFIHSEAFTENLQKELLELNFHEKSNDLYKFKQVCPVSWSCCPACRAMLWLITSSLSSFPV
jgi:hypothetical protein